MNIPFLLFFVDIGHKGTVGGDIFNSNLSGRILNVLLKYMVFHVGESSLRPSIKFGA